MKLVDVLRKECVRVGAQYASKADLLQEVAKLAGNSPILKDVSEQDLLDGLLKREELGSTGFGDGIAIPHCRLPGVSDFVLGIITVPGGVDFDALDGNPVNLVIFIIAPEIESDKHVRLLSAISQTLLARGIRQEMLAQKDPEGLYESFLRRTVCDLNSGEQKGWSLIHAFVQDENTFKDVLQVLAGIESASLVAMDAENTSAYLAKMPLFAEFWTDDKKKFCRIIMAVVEEGLTNETIRRIETITGDLAQCDNAMVTVQPISYVAGSLRA